MADSGRRIILDVPFDLTLAEASQAAAPALAAIGDRASEQLAHALDRLTRTNHHSLPVVQS